MKIKMYVSDSCVACHRCTVFYPEFFQSDAQGQAYPSTSEVSAESWDLVMDAAETCPVGAIVLRLEK